MKKLMIWTVGGFGLALACGLAGLPHLSATVFTLTVFCALQVLAVWFFGFVWSLPDRIAAWAEVPSSITIGGNRECGK
ncbi:hypothetical protein G6M85_11255 [Agrobacterium tumefaciens]|uniref:hypothetical protein n=1 Tax=Agrobacterium tumefaciens TaxID=358 RepID=UPI001573A65E|nr:hypothetical protein [Agrobacterium tumefaciens]NTE66186.1 hypothetical protein [Agrobacterium tumefaciens]